MTPDSSDAEYRTGRLDGLMTSLQALAAPFETQVAHFPHFVVVADELALNFDHWLNAVVCNEDLDLTAAQSESLRAIDDLLGSMGGPGGPWSLDDLRNTAQWRQVRVLARTALSELGWPINNPPPPPGHYVR